MPFRGQFLTKEALRVSGLMEVTLQKRMLRELVECDWTKIA